MAITNEEVQQTTARGHLAVVTGAGSGIGRAIAQRLAQSGYLCLLAGRRPGPLEETAILIAEAGGEALTVSADVTTVDGRTAIIDSAEETGARLYALVNNAGGGSGSPLFANDLKSWQYEFALHVE